MTTIYDLAKKTGISKSTISRVVSGNGYVSAEKRKIILDAMHEMNYIPNQVAKNLRSKRTNTIGFLINDYMPLVGELINAFTQIASKYGYSVNLYFTKNPEKELHTLDLLTSKRLDAVFIALRLNSWDTISSYAKFGPIATWQRVEHPHIYSNYIDHYPIYLKILERLNNEGYDHVGHILSPIRNGNTQARIKAIEDFSQQHPKSIQTFDFYDGQNGVGHAAAEKWLKSPNPPKAMLIFTDYVAADFIATLRKHHVRVPEDCLVIGSDNSEIASLMNFPTIDLCFRNQMHNGFIYLYNQLNDTHLPYEHETPHFIGSY
jgi:DNA-binding LacI/PurR family transcriptional regulator